MTPPRWSGRSARAHVEQRLRRRSSRAERLSGGLLNHVHRVWFADGAGSVVVKHAPPHVASAPDIPLDPSRSTFEAAGLRWAAARADPRVVVPRVLDAVPGTLLLEDLGDLPDLGAWLAAGGDTGVLDRLGGWLGGVHADAGAPDLWNRPVQQTRLAVQYLPVAQRLAALGVPDAASLGAVAVELGERLLARGDTMVMGDLWPPSALIGHDGTVHVIDWELCTMGQACQDLGHLAAHLWMGGHRGRWSRRLSARFLAAVRGRAPEQPEDTAVHFACEILVRAAGPFRGGGPYAGLPDGASELRSAVGLACDVLRSRRLPDGVSPPSWRG
jgi:hypothetical protein